MSHEALLAELGQRRDRAARMGGEEKLAERRSRGRLNARDRLESPVDRDSFLGSGVLGVLAIARNEERKSRDAKLVGFAKIDGGDVGAVVDPTRFQRRLVEIPTASA